MNGNCNTIPNNPPFQLNFSIYFIKNQFPCFHNKSAARLLIYGATIRPTVSFDTELFWLLTNRSIGIQFNIYLIAPSTEYRRRRDLTEEFALDYENQCTTCEQRDWMGGSDSGSIVERKARRPSIETKAEWGVGYRNSLTDIGNLRF